jgi:hypothetical protein
MSLVIKGGYFNVWVVSALKGIGGNGLGGNFCTGLQVDERDLRPI